MPAFLMSGKTVRVVEQRGIALFLNKATFLVFDTGKAPLQHYSQKRPPEKINILKPSIDGCLPHFFRSKRGP